MLRPVLEDSLEFMQLVDSIRDHGQLQSVLVRKHPHREGYYEIIDGMWRYSAIKRLTRPTIHAIIYTEELTDDEYLALQIQCNAVSYETRPIEFAEQMMRMIELHDEAGISLSIAQMARIVGKSSSWVSDRLKLVSLCDAAKAAVRQGRLPIGKAAALAKIKLHKYQEEFLALAPKMNTREFQLEVGRFIALKRDEKKGMRRNEREKIQLRPIIRSMDEMLMELDKMANISQIIVQNNLTSAREGARIALEWVLRLDKDSRNRQVTEIRHKLTNDERAEVIGRRRYEQLKELEQLRNDFDNN
jgi:ParB/RepB/Spo0J family partition protein